MPHTSGALDAEAVAGILALIVYSQRFGNPFGERR
jgi:hypothetical protein